MPEPLTEPRRGRLTRAGRPLAIGAIGLAAWLATAAPSGAAVNFEVGVSPERMSFPEGGVLTYTVTATTGGGTERFSIQPLVLVGPNGPAVQQLGAPKLSGPATLGATALRIPIGKRRCTTMTGGWKRATTFRHDVGIGPNSTAVLTYRFKARRPPPQRGLAPTFEISDGMVNPAFGPGTLAGSVLLDAPDPVARGQREVAVSLRIRPAGSAYKDGRPKARRLGVRYRIRGRVRPAVKGATVRLVARSGRHGAKRTVATVRARGDGRFAYDWRPKRPGAYELAAHYRSPRRDTASGWSCSRRLSLLK